MKSHQPSCSEAVTSTPDDWIRETRLYAQWSAMKEQILLHKWYESEKAGCDIGWEKAMASWMLHHRSGFTAARYKS